MDSNGKFQDPYSRKAFWISQFETKSRTDLETFLNDFERLASEMEKEFRIVMTAGRSEILREALLDLLRIVTKRTNNSNQVELF